MSEKHAIEKTNVMRFLDGKKVRYEAHYYGDTDAVGGVDVASVLGENPQRVFKTLVTESAPRRYYVFIVPVDAELDLKKAAESVGEKRVEMIKSKDLLPVTGYIHGGCSPFCMKKPFPTVADESARNFDTVFVSAGKIGYQIELSFADMEKLISVKTAPLTR